MRWSEMITREVESTRSFGLPQKRDNFEIASKIKIKLEICLNSYRYGSQLQGVKYIQVQGVKFKGSILNCCFWEHNIMFFD